jgi:hypothetical protein
VEVGVLVIPAKAGIQRLLLASQAELPLACGERVTFFFTRVKKEVTKKESTLVCSPGFTFCKSAKSRTVPVHEVGAGIRAVVK